jgi:hypothetical protein
MSDKPKKRVKKELPPTLKTDDELMDDLFGPEVREKLKEVAHKSRPKEK